MGEAAVRAACWEVASQVTVTGGGRGDGVTMATVQTAAKAKAMAQVGVVQSADGGRGCAFSLPSHYFSRADVVREDNRNTSRTARYRTVEEQSVGLCTIIICAVAKVTRPCDDY